MSHVARIEVEIHDVEALAAAGKKLGLELMRDQTSFKYYKDQRAACVHALRVVGNPMAYEVGVVAREDGGRGFNLSWDSYNGGLGLVACVGIGAKKLKQGYAVEVATRAAQRQGFRVVSSQTNKRGAVELVLQK